MQARPVKNSELACVSESKAERHTYTPSKKLDKVLLLQD